jgi:rubrerythrin
MDPKNIPDNMEEILQTAIQMEEKGYKYYSESSKRITNSVGKRMLERLASDEQNHIRRFTDMYNALTDNNIQSVTLEKVEPTTFDEVFNRLKEQLDGAVDELKETGVDDVEILEMALDLESHAKFFYGEASKKTDDPKLKEFLDLLAKEEQAHYDVLRKSQEFLEDPSLFFGMGNRL